MPCHRLTNFEIQKYQNEPRFNGVYSRDNLIKDGVYVTNLDGYSDIRTHWVALYVHNVTYFDSFGVEHILKEIKTFINNKNIKTNIFRIQAYDSIMQGVPQVLRTWGGGGAPLLKMNFFTYFSRILARF